MEKWTTDLIGPLLGRTALITGGTEGVGLEVARELARNGAKVIICADEIIKGEKALMDLRASMHGGQVSYEHIDFADLASVKEFADKFRIEHDDLHILINNHEVSGFPERMNSAQGHEMMFAVNYLSQFALTAQLFSLLEQADDARIVFQTSPMHEKGVMDFFDLDATHYYEANKAYAQSMLAMLIFARELDRRLRETRLEVKSIPVYSGAKMNSLLSRMFHSVVKVAPESAALPILFAATAPEAMSGHYYGPDGLIGLKGHPVEQDCALQAKNLQAAEKLWEISEEMCNFKFNMTNLSNVLPFQMRGNIRPEFHP